MRIIESLTDDALQQHSIVLDDNSLVTLTLRYLPAVQRWSVDIVHDSLTVYGLFLSNHPNIIRQYKNNAIFGIAITVTDGTDPILQDDFISGRASLYVLNRADVLELESYLFA